MGSVKKKPLAAMEKNQSQTETQQSQAPQKKAKEPKPASERKRNEVLPPRMSEQELLKSLTSLKAITVFGASRSLGVNISVAKGLLVALESKGLLKKVGGFSGHYVWSAVS
jgi:small subunit ribosomal protein S25e